MVKLDGGDFRLDCELAPSATRTRTCATTRSSLSSTRWSRGAAPARTPMEAIAKQMDIPRFLDVHPDTATAVAALQSA